MVEEKYDKISVLEKPIEVDIGEWAEQHLDCDTIVGWKQTASIVVVYAYSKSKDGNNMLSEYRDRYLTDKSILRGLPHEATQGIWNISEV